MGSHCHHLSPETAGKLPKQLIYHREGGSETDCINTPRGLLLFPSLPAAQEGSAVCQSPVQDSTLQEGKDWSEMHPKNVCFQGIFRKAKFTWPFWGGAVATQMLEPPRSVPMQAASVTAAPIDAEQDAVVL